MTSVNLSTIFTIFSILVNNAIVHMSHHFGSHETTLVGTYVLPWLPNYYFKWAGAVLIQGVHHCVIHRWKAELFSIHMSFVEL